jgi:tRNA(adenine34) deaminase
MKNYDLVTAPDQFFMAKALEQAELAVQQNQEVPVGAVLVRNNNIIAVGSNLSITNVDPTAHAEIVVIRQAAHILNNYRLIDTSLYVTLEPCAMCFGAILHARISRLIFGAKDPKFGAIESVVSLNNYQWNHKFNYTGGVLELECAAVLRKFFQTRR